MALIVKSSSLKARQPDLQEEWVEYQEGVKFLIRGIAHRFVQVGLQAKREKQLRVFDLYNSGNVSVLSQGKTEAEINNELLGELILVDWQGVTLENGEDLPYSEKDAIAILSNPEHQDLVVWILAESMRISDDAKKRVQERLGKS